jgi:hypothetical protein
MGDALRGRKTKGEGREPMKHRGKVVTGCFRDVPGQLRKASAKLPLAAIPSRLRAGNRGKTRPSPDPREDSACPPGSWVNPRDRVRVSRPLEHKPDSLPAAAETPRNSGQAFPTPLPAKAGWNPADLTDSILNPGSTPEIQRSPGLSFLALSPTPHPGRRRPGSGSGSEPSRVPCSRS